MNSPNAPDGGRLSDDDFVAARVSRAAVCNAERGLATPAQPIPAPGPVPTRGRGGLVWLGRQFGHAAWTLRTLAREGLPQDFFYYPGGLGDQLLCTAVFRERVKRGMPPAVMMSSHAGLFAHNPDVRRVLPEDPRSVELARRLGRRAIFPNYTYENIGERDVHFSPPYPIIARMCRLSGVEGAVDIRPYLFLTGEEKSAGRLAPKQVAIMSSGQGAAHPQRNKQWYPERYQAVVNRLKDTFDFVQLGDARDPALVGALDLRGRTTLRESAAVLSQSLVFVGQVGFLMHLARAVDCRGVIVYGGREMPFQTGYTCNENLYTPLPCSPCWQCNTCDFDRECLKRITPGMVADAVTVQADRFRTPLPTASYTIVPASDW